jgi:hypothetical protein
MNIYFDYERFGNAEIDAFVNDLFLSTKQKLVDLLSNLKKEIEKEHGIFLLIFKPTGCHLTFMAFSNELTTKIKKATDKFDIEKIIKEKFNSKRN